MPPVIAGYLAQQLAIVDSTIGSIPASDGATSVSVIFDLTTARLIEHTILLLGVMVLARLIARVHDRVAAHFWHG